MPLSFRFAPGMRAGRSAAGGRAGGGGGGVRVFRWGLLFRVNIVKW